VCYTGNCSPYAGIAERIEFSPIKRRAPVVCASTIKDSEHNFSVVTDTMKLSPWLHDLFLRKCACRYQQQGKTKSGKQIWAHGSQTFMMELNQ
jgi:hypothetical protein